MERIVARLHEEEDKDIIEFLADKPVTYIVKLAIRRFMNDSRDVLSEIPVKSEVTPEGEGAKDDASIDDILGGFSK